MKAFTRFGAAILCAAIFAGVPLAALADLYVNPKDGLKSNDSFYGETALLPCFHWGSSVRCVRQATLHFTDPPYSDRKCEVGVWYTTNGWGSVQWHAKVHEWVRKCRIHWTNNNTLNVYLK